jgi:Ran GTPase-activating protein (RanGAP) involved in mRNA processing and transport
MRDNLKWKLGLRITQEIDVSKLGIRYLHLGKNLITNKGATQMAQALKQDAYMRAINLHKNKLTEAGMLEMLAAVQFNKSILLMDVTGNSNAYEKKKINE